jgi:hypothetical protein
VSESIPVPPPAHEKICPDRGPYVSILDVYVGRLEHALRWLSHHTGIPALLVAAILIVVGWKILKRSARLAVEVAVVAAVLVAATELGWIRW